MEMQSGLFRSRLDGFIQKYSNLWNGSPDSLPQFPEHHSAEERRRNEEAAERLITDLDAERARPAKPNVAGLRERLKRLASECGAAGDSRLHMLESDDVWEVTLEFLRRARSFDRSLDAEALSQALRNVWVMNWIQIALSRKVVLSDSIFAYSLLYPYTDNYLDGATVNPQEKRRLSQRLRNRLQGCAPATSNRLEKVIFHLVGLIEREWPRGLNPGVHLSLLAIHDAQLQSMRQHASGAADANLLGTEVYKGGSSVLADAYLVLGSPGDAHAEFFFGLGVLLQFLDDLQDQTADATSGQKTLFSRAASAIDLERVSSRFYHFLCRFLDDAARPPELPEALFREVRRSCTVILLMAVAQNAPRYRTEYLRSLESSSPVSFAYLNRIHSRISSRKLVRMLCPAIQVPLERSAIF
jgi:hypothetical protein